MNMLQPPVVVLMTDFGITDTFIGQMKGVILSLCPIAQLIDLTHAVLPQNVVQGAFLLGKSLPFLPDGSVVVAVVDPGVGSTRRIIAVQTSRHTFLAPDNGLLTPMLASGDVQQCVSVTNERYMLPQRSSTFHGRDIFSPVAAHLAAGVPLAELGKSMPMAECVQLEVLRANVLDNGNCIESTILYTDHFGNAVTTIERELLAEKHDWLIHVNELRLPLSTTYSDVAEHQPIAYIGSSGTLEIAIRNGNAAAALGLHAGVAVRMERGEWEVESGMWEEVVQAIPDLLKQGVTLHQSGKHNEAEACYQQILKQQPHHIDALHLLGVLFYHKKEYSKALDLLNQAIALKPTFTEAYSNRGAVLKELKRFDEALASYNKALELKENYAAAWYNRANLLKEWKQFSEAIESYNKAIEFQPNYPEAYSNRGVVLKELKQFDAAFASYNQAIALKPTYVEAYSNKGTVLKELKQLDAAIESFNKAIALKPDYAEVQWNKSLVLLLSGNFIDGWMLYEWRWKKADFTSPKRNFTQPLWLGKESLEHKTILLHSEQGLGDTLQFCRYATLVAKRGARVILEVPDILIPLLKQLEGVEQIIAKGKKIPPFDYHTPLLSLPLAFTTRLENIPSPSKYLFIDNNKIEEWKQRLHTIPHPRIGLVWSGRAEHKNDHNRSIALADLLRYLPNKYHYVSLQKEVRDSDKKTLDVTSNMVHFGNELHDFADTAALCELMDLVISVDTSVAHLSASLGKPTWILLPFIPDWRWLLDRNDTPWYASATLYRQHTRDDWESVLKNIATDLYDYFTTDNKVAVSHKATKAIQALLKEAIKLHQSGKQNEAAICYKNIIQLQPNHVDALHLLGVVAFQKEQYNEALNLLNQAIALNTDFASAYFNRGLVFKNLYHFDKALEDFDRALRLKPNYAEAYHKRGNILKELGLITAALSSYNNALALKADYAGVYLDKAIILLLLGNFADGWDIYEWRWKCKDLPLVQRNFTQPLWLGQKDIQSKTILLHSEQGLGDTIQFCRYTQLVAERGALVILEVPASLASLMQSLEGVTEIVVKGKKLPPFDCHCPLLSLPLACNTTLENIPSPSKYLSSNTKKRNKWKDRLQAIPQPRIGLVWSGSTQHKNDRNRSIELSELLQYLPDAYHYISLQKELRESDKATVEATSNIVHFGDALHDFADTAALCELVDIVISVDTSVAHLSAALGKPTWILLPYIPDWRWLLDRNDTPWYASATLYRQAHRDDWLSVFKRLQEDLQQRCMVESAQQQLPIHTSQNNHIATLLQQGVQLHKSGKQNEAELCYQKILQLQPNHADALHLLGVLSFQKENYSQSLELLNQAIAIKSDFASAYFNRGLVLKNLSQFEKAIEDFNKAIEQKPEYASAYHSRGTVQKELKQFDAALKSYEKAIALKPDYTEAYCNRGNALQLLKRFNEAIDSYNKAIALKPQYAEAYSNRGVVFRELKELDTSLDNFNKAIELKADYAEAYSNRGVVFRELKMLDNALADFNKAIELKKDYAIAYWNKSLVLLLLGNFAEGWQCYEWRWKKADFTSPKRNFTQPLWLGEESIADKTILLHSEQGLGDTIQFCRYAPLVAELGARVVLEIPSSLALLLQPLDGVAEVIVKGKTLPPFDYHCPLLSLPLAFKTTLETIPFPTKYLSLPSHKIKQWQQRIGNIAKPRIGLVWSGSTKHKNDHNRSIELSKLLEYLPDHYHYISLQKELRESDKATLEATANMVHFGDELHDFTDTAALCELVELVISVDTSVAHLAAALGKPTWILLPFIPDWRWLLDRNDTPWYASATLYRQHTRDDWTAALERLHEDLRQRFLVSEM
uniref:TPR repeat n=1 Tax=Chlorobium chlorochromatii (strain CaD3) TaxID=340177 RepID=Q3ATU8_CHLCH